MLGANHIPQSSVGAGEIQHGNLTRNETRDDGGGSGGGIYDVETSLDHLQHANLNSSIAEHQSQEST